MVWNSAPVMSLFGSCPPRTPRKTSLLLLWPSAMTLRNSSGAMAGDQQRTLGHRRFSRRRAINDDEVIVVDEFLDLPVNLGIGDGKSHHRDWNGSSSFADAAHLVAVLEGRHRPQGPSSRGFAGRSQGSYSLIHYYSVLYTWEYNPYNI